MRKSEKAKRKRNQRLKKIKKQSNIAKNNLPKSKVVYMKNPVSLLSVGDVRRTRANQVMQNGLDPDYGEYIRTSGMPRRQTVYIEQPTVMMGSYGMIGFKSGGFLGTIETTNEIAKKYVGKPFIGVIELDEDSRYLTNETQEWVTPFKIVELL